MKKKVKDLTLEEVKKICGNQDCPSCPITKPCSENEFFAYLPSSWVFDSDCEVEIVTKEEKS